jgi:hypothetical protein
MNPAGAALLQALRQPESLTRLAPDAADLVSRQATSAGLLGRLAHATQASGIEAGLPVAVQRRLVTARLLATQQQRALRRELLQITTALEELPGPVLLLKGAAYAAAELPLARGRMFSDIDLLVPRGQLNRAETLLMVGGWLSVHHDAYDQRYYRQWMHELPPLRHIARETVIDLHHNILPETARLRPRAERILEASRPLATFPRFRIPCAEDLVLHSATHLFHEGEWAHGLRGLVDLDDLLRHGAATAGFWTRLLERARDQDLGRPLYYALSQCTRWLATPVPEGLLQEIPGRPSTVTARFMGAVFGRAHGVAHWSLRTPLSGVAERLLYVRSHWLRMPAHLLIPHLVRKALVASDDDGQAAPAPP